MLQPAVLTWFVAGYEISLACGRGPLRALRALQGPFKSKGGLTLPSLKVDLGWGLFADLGPILGALGVMVSTI